MKKILALVLLVFTSMSFAQNERTLTYNEDTNLIDVVYYHDNGKISQTGSYTVEGKLHGEWLSYCEEGNKIVSAKYDKGQKVDKWFYWSGTTLKEVDYSNNAIASVNEWSNKEVIVSRNK